MFSFPTRCLSFSLSVLFAATLLVAQEPAPKPVPVVPSIVNFPGTLTDASGQPMTGVVGVTFLLYREQQGGAPLWMETQNVRPDKAGRYAVMLGSTTSQGLPSNLFVSGEARWLGVQISGQPEQPRVLLLSVPYAMKAADAETLGGLPLSAFMLATPSVATATGAGSSTAASTAATPPAGAVTGSGTANYVPRWTSASNIGNSALFQSGAGATAKVGINTVAPVTPLDVKGAATVRGNLSLPATGNATAAAGKNSQPTTFTASAFNSGSSTAVNQNFRWQAEPVGNNSATASGSLNLLFARGAAAMAETGLRVASNGQITFAAGQNFPGTGPGTITGVTAGTGLTGGGAAGAVTLGLDTTKVPGLGSNNSYTGTQKFLGNAGIGVPPSGTTYTPLSIGSANGFGTWFSIANTSTGGHTWNIISAGGGNAEGAGNFGITDLTGKSTIWLEGNTNTSNLTASGSAGGAVVDADIQGTNTGAVTPGLRFGGGASGEGISSNRVAGINRFGLQLFTNFSPRLSILNDGQVGIGATHPTAQLEVDSTSDGFPGIFVQGGAAATGSGQNGSDGIVAYGNTGDPNSSTSVGGNGISAFGVQYGAGGVFTGGAPLGDGIDAYVAGSSGTFGPWAGLFYGPINANGDIVGNSISTRVDHPLDPANKYLFHSSVQSSEMKNMYDGTVTTDADGQATVELPEWFESLNRDFRYQLTVIGQFAQAIVASKITNHHFAIRTDKPNVEVSWQVTGVRQDAWANAHRTPVEANKPALERGHYVHPELYGAPEESGIEWARHPQIMKRLKDMRQIAKEAR